MYNTTQHTNPILL